MKRNNLEKDDSEKGTLQNVNSGKEKNEIMTSPKKKHLTDVKSERGKTVKGQF